MKAAKQPTQTVLGDLFNKIDKAADYADCIFHAAAHEAMTGYITVVADDLHKQLETMKAVVHELVEWA